MHSLLKKVIFVPLLAGAATTSFGQITVYDFDTTAFTSNGGAGIALDFDSIADNTVIEGSTFAGATFNGPGSALTVVRGADTFTTGWPDPENDNKLLPTSGDMVLSPGGKELPFEGPLQDDRISITFAAAVQSFGFDMLYQSYDFAPFSRVEIYDSSNNLLLSYNLPADSSAGGGDAPGGSEFYGFISATRNIGRVAIIEEDSGGAFPDSNIGIDSLRFEAVPEPGTMAVLGLGVVAALRRRKR